MIQTNDLAWCSFQPIRGTFNFIRFDLTDLVDSMLNYILKTSKVLLRQARGNRESGANPERSRHCNGEALFWLMSLVIRGRQKKKLMIQSQETYLACVTKPFAERKGVRIIRKQADRRFAW